MDFKEHLAELENAALETNKTASGHITIKQSLRNKLRKQLEAEFYDFLQDNDICCWQTLDGIIIPVENKNLEDNDICIELKMSIKALDYDPDMAIAKFDEHEKKHEDKTEDDAD